MKSTFLLILPLIALFLSSCAEEIPSDNIPTEEILRHYYAHSTNDGKVYVTAEFYADGGLTIPPFREPFGKTITLNPPAKVVFNGQEMEMKKGVLGEVSYSLSLDQWPTSFEWVWTDKDGQTHSNKANMQTISLSNNPFTQRGDKFVVQWNGAPIQTGEEVRVSLDRGEQAFVETSSDVGSQSIAINSGGYNLNYSEFDEVDISRTLIVSDTKEISVENVAGAYIKLVHTYEERRY
ncbi:MAG: hypothetical protein GY810_03565 [Aureispira sp.]|nr:hypothetical protein [Aureispira sp.]